MVEAPRRADVTACPNCGKKIMEGWKKCPYCLTPLPGKNEGTQPGASENIEQMVNIAAEEVSKKPLSEQDKSELKRLAEIFADVIKEPGENVQQKAEELYEKVVKAGQDREGAYIGLVLCLRKYIEKVNKEKINLQKLTTIEYLLKNHATLLGLDSDDPKYSNISVLMADVRTAIADYRHLLSAYAKFGGPEEIEHKIKILTDLQNEMKKSKSAEPAVTEETKPEEVDL